ncbi:winged helix DNA-binding domain-containing protein [Carnobacterium pleistocenium]|uniref:winged helix DNA-binding domain-containing protein n=1 Tax=Carnobacterium pleistocenium TaxID=181073 RepID=UPI000554C92D|nr:winged helix DNA-binding domain-containing protein [Carnobacterium pleistocenium]
MDVTSIPYQRLYTQRIEGEHFQSAEETVEWMGAVQAQDYKMALWAIGLRTPGSTISEVEQAIFEKKIIRTWIMRHTIHFVSIQDVSWMIELSSESMINKHLGHVEKNTGLTVHQLNQAKEILYLALKKQQQLTRPEIRTVLENADIDTSNQRLYHILWYAAQSGMIFIGPMKGKQQTFLLIEDWMPKGNLLSQEKALKKLAIRYVTSHGPATVHDFAWWAGLTIAKAKKGMQLADNELFTESRNKKEYWLPIDRQVIKSEKVLNLTLLPSLDEYLIGYKDRTDVFSAEVYSKIDPQKSGFFFPLIENGQVVGSWKPVHQAASIDLTIQLVPTIFISKNRLKQAAEHYCYFFKKSLGVLTVETIL